MNSFLFNKYKAVLLSTLAIFFVNSIVAETFRDSAVLKSCGSKISSQKQKFPPYITASPQLDALYLQADTGIIQRKGFSSLKGNIIIQQNALLFNADSAKVNPNKSIVSAQGNVTFSTNDMSFKSRSINLYLDQFKGSIEEADYNFKSNGSHGKSKKIELIDENNLTLSDATYTSCPSSNNSWHFASSSIKLDKKRNIGKAKNVTLRISNVPVFYFPWLNFPLNNQRLSGFLSPKLRFQSNTGITIPYYLNLAPNYDATLMLSAFKDSGIKLDNEFRYLTKNHQGKIEYDFIPKDRSILNNNYRDYFNIRHKTRLSPKTIVNINAEGVSDKDYFNDLATSLEDSSRSALQRRLEVSNRNGSWVSSAAIEDYQILDINNAPYAKLPELQASYQSKKSSKKLQLSANTEYIYFNKKNATTGSRAHIKLKASKKWANSYGYFQSTASLQHTEYSLKNNSVNSISRSLPTFTFDTGLYFEKKLSNNNLIQTIEPRLFYTYTPYKDQNSIPIFDTAQINFSATNQLFSENRFTGKDRIADNNQLTFAVSSKVQNRNTGKELFKASIGQVFNFDDKKVTLPGGTIQSGKRSDLVLEFDGRINDNLKLAVTGLWSHEKKRIPSYELRLNYQNKQNAIANISYRQLDTELKQLTLSGVYPINNKWSAISSIDHDLKNKRSLETLFGLEYNDCCWKTRLVAKRYLTSDNTNYETPIFLEFELKGLGSVGTGASRQLREKIYGYDDY